MSTWDQDEYDKLAAAREIEITSPKSGGGERDPVTIWVVGIDDELYVRSVRGGAGAWFQGAEARHEGHVEGGGVDRDVSFQDADEGVDDAVDAAYREKYRDSPSPVESITSADSRATTLRLLPR